MRRRSSTEWWRIASPWRWADRVCCRVWLLSMTLSSGLPQKKAREERDDALAWAQHKIEERHPGARVVRHDVPGDSRCLDHSFAGACALLGRHAPRLASSRCGGVHEGQSGSHGLSAHEGRKEADSIC
jgi:hypothetical protein